MTRQRWLHLGFGTAFGVTLCVTGAADFDAMQAMLHLRSAHLFGLGAVTTATAVAGLWLLRGRAVALATGCPVTRAPRPLHLGVVPGAVLFGIGWSISGSCPGTALAQVGQGHWIAGATVLGIAAGMAAHRVLNERLLRWRAPSCE